MTSLIAVVLLHSASTPQELLLQVLKGYQQLDSYSVTIEHFNSSGLHPGEYTQSLRWKKGGRFELKVLRTGPQHAGTRVPPDFYSDGKVVINKPKTGRETRSPVKPDPNTSPGWEVTGGPIMTALMNARPLEQLVNPTTPGLRVEMRFGTRDRWQGVPVQHIVATFRVGPEATSVNFFLDRDAKAFVGFEAAYPQGLGTLWYREENRNPELPENLGDPRD